MDKFLARLAAMYEVFRQCKYGENAWQQPAYHLRDLQSEDPLALHKFELIEGDPSYNNLAEIDRLLQTITHFAAVFDVNQHESMGIAVGSKHGNACGAAFNDDHILAFRNMLDGDPISIYGGLVITNIPISVEIARELRTWNMEGKGKRLLDGIIAPEFEAGAREELSRNEQRCRLLINPDLANLTRNSLDQSPRFRHVRGGMLVQPNYTYVIDFNDPDLVRYGSFTEFEERDLQLAWSVGSTSNSNTNTIVKNGMVLANAVGRQDRVGAADLALAIAKRGGHNVVGAVLYSDSFFPFPDGPQLLADAGIKAILTSSGSVKDKLTIDLCQERGIKLMMIPDAKGRGFSAH